MEWETEEGEEMMCKSLGRQAAGGQDTAGLTARKDTVPGGAAEQGSNWSLGVVWTRVGGGSAGRSFSLDVHLCAQTR